MSGVMTGTKLGHIPGVEPLVFSPGVIPLEKCLRRALLPVLLPLANSLTNVPFPRDSVLFSWILPLAKGNVSCSVWRKDIPVKVSVFSKIDCQLELIYFGEVLFLKKRNCVLVVVVYRK